MLKHTQHAKKTGRFGSTCQYFVVLDSVFHKWAVTSTEPQVLQVAIKICTRTLDMKFLCLWHLL